MRDSFGDVADSRALVCRECGGILWATELHLTVAGVAALIAAHVDSCPKNPSQRKRQREEEVENEQRRQVLAALGLDPARCQMGIARLSVDGSGDTARRVSQAVLQQSVSTPVFSLAWLRY